MSRIVKEELGVMYSIREEEEEEEKQELSGAVTNDHGSAEKQEATIFDDDNNVGSSNYITFNIFTQEGKEMMWYRTMSREDVGDVSKEEGVEKQVRWWRKKVEGVIGRMTKSSDGDILVERKKGNGARLMGGCLYGIGKRTD